MQNNLDIGINVIYTFDKGFKCMYALLDYGQLYYNTGGPESLGYLNLL